MTTKILNSESLPFCKGCGHDLIAKNTAKALEALGFSPLDVIIVTDIGCHGIIDKNFNTHTVHGLHGRSVAIGAGIAFGTQSAGKKIIVFVGDGGATIGLQHILEAARLNLNMTVVVHNNMLYGMTGGQSSGLTPEGFHTTTSMDGNPYAGFDLCALTHAAGAAYVSRLSGIGDFSEKLAKAFSVQGFSLVEVVEICPSYGVKFNPGRKLNEIIETSGHLTGEWFNQREVYQHKQGNKYSDLISRLSPVKVQFRANLDKPVSIIISGSAGEGVQLTATLFCKAAMKAGLHVTQKGSYPVTVGVGFSTAEVNLSTEEIHFHGITVPDLALITSSDGLSHSARRLSLMTRGQIFIEQTLPLPETKAEIIQADFRSVGARSASMMAVCYLLKETSLFPIEALFETIQTEGFDKKIPLEKIRNALALS